MNLKLTTPPYLQPVSSVLTMLNFVLIGYKPDVRLALYQRNDHSRDHRIWIENEMGSRNLQVRIMEYEKDYSRPGVRLKSTQLFNETIDAQDTEPLLDFLLDYLYRP